MSWDRDIATGRWMQPWGDLRTAPAIRVGIVEQQDLQLARVRARFTDYDHTLSYWLHVLVTKSQNDKFYWIPDIGEQVICLMDERDEAGCVLGAIYSTADPTPVQSADKWHVTFKDGAILEYDRASHAWKITTSGTVTITAPTIKLDGATEVTGDLKVDGATNVQDINIGGTESGGGQE